MGKAEEFDLKPLSAAAIGAAFEKAMRYRLLNQPRNAESICRDILRADPDHHDARIGLLLCITDQFERDLPRFWPVAEEAVERLEGYEKLYHQGIMAERRAKAHYGNPSPMRGNLAHSWLSRAMDYFDQAAACRPAGNDEALLRWNTCARMIMQNADICPQDDDAEPTLLE